MSFLNTKPIIFSQPGYHIARCVGIIEYGTIFIISKWQAQVRFTFELPNDRREFSPGSAPCPKLISKEYASNLYGKSHLKRLRGAERKRPSTGIYYGYDPRAGDVYEKCRKAVGGDDFVESIALTPEIRDGIAAGFSMSIDFSMEYFDVALIKLAKI